MSNAFIPPDVHSICENADTTATVYYIREHGLVESLKIISDLINSSRTPDAMKQYLYNLESIMLTGSGTLTSIELFLNKQNNKDE